MKRSHLKTSMPRLPSVETLGALALEGAEYRGWYADAGREIERAAIMLATENPRGSMELGTRARTLAECLADLLSLFSPRVSILRSCKFTIAYARGEGFLYDVMGSIRLSVNHWEKTGEIRGPKTSRFASALKGNPDACVLDTWMGLALGVDRKRFHDSKTVYEVCERRIRETAEYRGWTVAETQAAIWGATVARERAIVPPLSLMSLIDGIPI